MSQLETSLILTGDARGLIVASKQGQQELDKLGQSVIGLGRDQKSAQASAELLQAQHRQVTAAAELQSQATRRLTTSTAGGAGGMQNFSYQLQDIFTQVGMGVPLLISLGQQAPQILSGFGTIGAMFGVAAAAILPLTAVIFGLGYGAKETAEKVKSASELMQEAFDAIGNAQSILKSNSIDNLDAVKDKYGEVTRSVLTLLQAQNELALQQALTTTRTGLESTFGEGAFADLEREDQKRLADIQERKDIIAQALGDIELNVDVENARAAIETMREEIAGLEAGADLQKLFQVDGDTLSRVITLKDEIKSTFAAENYEGMVSSVTELREILQFLPDGPLRDKLEGMVNSESALLEAVHTSESFEEMQKRIALLAERTGGIDVSSNIAVGGDQATRMADELGRALSNAIALANQGVGSVDRARINYEFRDDPLGRAGALAGAEFDARASLPKGTDSTIRNVVEKEKREFVSARVEAERYNLSLQQWRKEQAAAARTSSGSKGGGGSRGRSRGRGRSEEERVITDIGKQMDRLAPSYERDIASLNEWRDNALSTLSPAREGYENFARDVETIFDERLAEAYREDLARRIDWASGVERAFLDINDDLKSWADVGESIAERWSSGLEDAFVQMGRTGKIEVGSLVDYTLEQFQRMAYQQAIQPGLQMGFSMLTDFVGGLFPGVAAAGSTPMTQSHAGSTIGTGGVRRSYGGGAPLRADERLTVTTLGQRVFTPEQIGNGATVVDALAKAAASGGGGAGSVTFAPTIQIENQGSTPVQGRMEEQSDGQGGRSYKLVLADQVGVALTQPGGGARKALRRNGLKPKRAQR
mgnify:FL=1